MARQARIKSETGIYHVMLRGNEGKSVFLEAEDKDRFVEIMLQKKEVAGTHLYAYCVLSNHLHMVVRELAQGEPLESVMKRIGVTYAAYFNRKYRRVGHVFQDRFRSEVIEDEPYLFSVIRYIHANPVKEANLPQGLNYVWSSYLRYIGQQPLLPEMEKILDQFSRDRRTAMKLFAAFQQETDIRVLLDVPEAGNAGEKAEDILEDFLQSQQWTKAELHRKANRAVVSDFIKTLVQRSGISGRDVAEITGINREKVRRMLMSINDSTSD